MNIPFRQGLVSFPTGFLQAGSGSGVSLIATSGRITATFAHGASNYLQVIDASVTNAWPNIPGGSTSYLYADIDLLTAVVTYGFTALLPVVSSVAPSSPANNKHWFDLGTTTMKVWNATTSTWQVKIRVFLGNVPSGNIGSLVPSLSGTQVALTTPVDAGFIMKDSFGRPLRKSTGEFLTTADQVLVNSTANTSGVLVQPAEKIMIVKAGEAIPAMSMAYLSDADEVRLASSNPALSPAHIPIGLITVAMARDDVSAMVTQGEVSYDQWDWTGYAGQPLYIDDNGVLTRTRPAGLLAYRVGFIKNSNTIIVGIDAETFPQVFHAGDSSLVITGTSPIVVSDVTNGLGERVVTIGSSGGSGGGGSSTFASLTDKTTVDLPTINGPLSTALGLKASVIQLNAANSNIALKADATALSAGLALKADSTALTSGLANKSDVGHTHTSSAITDFAEAVDDRVAALLVAGSGVTLTYNDAGNALTITASGGGGGSTTFAALTDKVTVDLPTVNTPLSTALAAKATLQTGALAASTTVAPNATAVQNAIAAAAVTIQTGALVASTTAAPNATAVQNAIAAGDAPVSVSYATAIPLDRAGNGKYMPRTTLTSNTTFSIAASPVEQGVCVLNLVSNGTAVPTFPASFVVSGAPWSTTNKQQMFYFIMYTDGVALVNGVLGPILP